MGAAGEAYPGDELHRVRQIYKRVEEMLNIFYLNFPAHPVDAFFLQSEAD